MSERERERREREVGRKREGGEGRKGSGRKGHDKLHSHVDEKCDRDRVQVRCSDLVGSDLPHPLIDVRQIAASVKVRELCVELLEEL